MELTKYKIPGYYLFGTNDSYKFDVLKHCMGGIKIRGKMQFYFPKKASNKIWDHFPEITVNCSKEIQEEIDGFRKTKEKRLKNIDKIKQQYLDFNIKFEYDTSRMKYEPLPAQKIMYNLVRYSNCCYLGAEAGTMKTGPYLWAIDDYMRIGKVKRALIITLSSLKKNVLAEMAIQIPNRTGVVLKGKKHADIVINHKFKRASKNIDYDIYIANYESMSGVKDVFPDDYFDMVVLDEAHRIANKTNQTEAILSKFINTERKYIVTGSLNDDKITSHVNPFRFLGEDNIPIVNFNDARAYYMQQLPANPHIWIEKRGMRKEVAKLIGIMGIEYKKEECLDLPGVVTIQRFCDMGNEQKRMTDELKDELITIVKDMCENCSSSDDCDDSCDETLEGKNALVVVGKFQQIANGFIQRKIENDDDGKSKTSTIYIDIKENPKLKVLDDIISEIGNKKVIIWSNRIRSLETIYNHLNKKYKGKKGKGVLRIWGSDDAYDTVQEFKKSQYQFLAANPAKAATGLNIQFSNYQVTFDNSFSFREYDQKISRQYRGGQTEIVTIYQIILRNSVDESVIKKLEGKKELGFVLGQFARLSRTLKDVSTLKDSIF